MDTKILTMIPAALAMGAAMHVTGGAHFIAERVIGLFAAGVGALFGTFGDAFFRRYAEHRPIAREFFSERRDLYNLYPLLVHTALFGGGYARSAAQTIDRYL